MHVNKYITHLIEKRAHEYGNEGIGTNVLSYILDDFESPEYRAALEEAFERNDFAMEVLEAHRGLSTGNDIESVLVGSDQDYSLQYPIREGFAQYISTCVLIRLEPNVLSLTANEISCLETVTCGNTNANVVGMVRKIKAANYPA